MSSESFFFVSSGFQVLECFCMFFGAMNWFNKIYRMFLGVLGQTWVQNNFLGEKTKNLVFPVIIMVKLWGWIDDMSFAPLNLKTYIGLRAWACSCRAVVGLLLDWARQWPRLLGLAVSSPILFFFNFIFLKNNFYFLKEK
jgi:hypothetical protein